MQYREGALSRVFAAGQQHRSIGCHKQQERCYPEARRRDQQRQAPFCAKAAATRAIAARVTKRKIRLVARRPIDRARYGRASPASSPPGSSCRSRRRSARGSRRFAAGRHRASRDRAGPPEHQPAIADMENEEQRLRDRRDAAPAQQAPEIEHRAEQKQHADRAEVREGRPKRRGRHAGRRARRGRSSQGAAGRR